MSINTVMDVEEGKLEEELVDKPGNHDRNQVLFCCTFSESIF